MIIFYFFFKNIWEEVVDVDLYVMCGCLFTGMERLTLVSVWSRHFKQKRGMCPLFEPFIALNIFIFSG